jgi:hypothetical protein
MSIAIKFFFGGKSLWAGPTQKKKKIRACGFVLHNPAGLGESFDFLKSSKLTTRLWSVLQYNQIEHTSVKQSI